MDRAVETLDIKEEIRYQVLNQQTVNTEINNRKETEVCVVTEEHQISEKSWCPTVSPGNGTTIFKILDLLKENTMPTQPSVLPAVWTHGENSNIPEIKFETDNTFQTDRTQKY